MEERDAAGHRRCPGAAATATFAPGADGKLEALVTIVTTMDGAGPDRPGQEAPGGRREQAALTGVVQENTRWWNAFYDKREDGRVFSRPRRHAQCSDDIRAIYRSYADSHGGGTKTDMRQFECSAS